jgi:hypothetical protein
MSKIIIYLGSLLVVVNTINGLLISNYLPFNWLSVDAVLIINTILLYKLSTDNISNGYKISLSFVYPFLCFVSIVLAFLSPNKFKDNYYVIGFVFLMLIEISLYLIAKNIKLISNKN